MAAISRYFAHACVLIVALAIAGYASVSKDLPAAARLRLGVVNAQGMAMAQGGTTGSVELGRMGTIVKPVAVPTQPQVQHQAIPYLVQNGDDVYTIAAKFAVSANEVRWSNPAKLTKTDRISAGDRLLIPPVPGVVYTVKPGDSVDAIAGAYHVAAQAVIDFNYLRGPADIAPGRQLVLPNGVGPQLWPRRASDEPPHLGSFPNSKFAFGQCTWYVASRRLVPWTGDAWQWFANAEAMGFQTGKTPQPGAIMVTWESPYYGHVAYVEQVNENGSFIVSEMNYKGWDQIDERTLSPADFSQIRLIGFIY